MKLLVTTPVSAVLEVEDVLHVRAEDETGAFGILPGHADFITVLSISVITWRDQAGERHHIAVRGGVLTVRGGQSVEIATRDAVGENTLRQLGDAVLTKFRDEAAAEKEARVSTTRLHLATIRQLQRYLEAGRQPVPMGTVPPLSASGARPEEGGYE